VKNRLTAIVRQMEQVELQLDTVSAFSNLANLIGRWAAVVEETIEHLETLEETEGTAAGEVERAVNAAVRDASAYPVPERAE